MEWQYRNTVLSLVVLANLGQMASRLVISPLVPDILDTFSTSKAAVGLALTGMWVAYALVQFPSGVLGARFGERRVIAVSLGLIAVGSIWLAVSPSFVFFGCAVFFLGAGAGLYFSVAANLLSKLFSKHGQAIGFTTAAGSLAGLVAPVVGAYVGTQYSWRVAALLGAAIALPLLVLFRLRVRPTRPESPNESLRRQVTLSTMVGFLTAPSVVYTIFLAAAGTFAFQAVISFFPTFLVEQRHLTTQSAGLLFGVIFLLSAMAQPLTGRLSDKVGHDIVIAGSMLVAMAGLLLLLYETPWFGVAGAVLLLGIGLSWFPVVLSRFLYVLPDTDRSKGFGLVRTVYMLFGALGSLVTGTVAQTQGWMMAYGVVAGLLAFSVLLIVVNQLADLDL